VYKPHTTHNSSIRSETSAFESLLLHAYVSVSFAKYVTLTALTIFGHKQRSPRGFVRATGVFLQCLACPLCVTTFFPHLWIYMDNVFGQLHLLMLGTELEAVPPDTVSFELCVYSYLRASCVHSDRVCRLY